MKISKIFKSPLFITLILIIPSVFALLKPGYYNMHDDMQMIRQLELEKCIKDGQIPCRWSPDLGYEYGYPLFNFYPPLPYMIGQIFRFLGFSFIWSVKLTAVTQFISSGIAMYLLVSYLSTPLAGLLASLFYTYAPYHAVNIYIRAAMNEAWASVFFPLIFLFIKKIIDKPNFKNIILLSLSVVGLMLSHNPMLLVFALFSFPWIFYCLIEKYKINKKIIDIKPVIFNLILSAFLALGLAAFYTLPVILESKLTQIDSMFQGYYSYEVHFVSLYQLFISNFWGDGASVWGTEDGMPFMVGYLHWIIPLIFMIYFVYGLLKNKTKANKLVILNLFIMSLALLSLFLTHSRSIFIYKLFSSIQKMQFSWRFLNLSIFFLSISCSLSIKYFLSFFKQNKTRNLFILLVIFLLFSINFGYFKPLKSGPLTDEQKFSGSTWQNQTTASIYDYLPITARTAAKSKANFVVDSVNPDSSAHIYGQKKGTDWLFFNANVLSESQITLAQLYFPNFKIYNYGQPLDFVIEPELGRMVLNLTPGNYQIYAKLNNTPIRSISNFISLFSWILLIFSAIYALKRNRNH